MTEYADDVAAPFAFPGEDLADVLAQLLASDDVGQLHVAETEKYAHVTYFFDGVARQAAPAEDWELIALGRRPDLRPCSRAWPPGCRRLVAGLADALRFCIVNFANRHGRPPGVLPARRPIERPPLPARWRGGLGRARHRLVTADHGNAEPMLEPDGSPHTAPRRTPFRWW